MKHISRLFLLLVTLLAPLAARADLASITYRAPTANEIWHDGLEIFRTFGLPVLVGCGLLNWIYRRIRHRTPLTFAKVCKRWIIWLLLFFALGMTLSALCPRPEIYHPHRAVETIQDTQFHGEADEGSLVGE